MVTQHYQQPTRPILTRRRLLTGLVSGAAVVVGGGVISGCGRSEPETSKGGAAGGGGGTLRINSFGGTFQEAIERTVATPFEDEYGVSVDITTAISSDALTMLRSGRGNPPLDLAYMDLAVLYSARRAGLLQHLDLDAIPNSEQLYDIAVDPDGYWIAELLAMTGIAYNTEKVQNPPASWQDLWNPEYRDMVAISDVSGTAGYQFLVQAARLNGGDERNIDPGFEAIQRLKPNIVAFYDTPDQMSKLLSSGEVALGPWYNDRLNSLQEAGAPVEFVEPEEGGIAIISAMCVPQGTENPELAMQWIDHQVSAEINEAFCVEMKEGPTNETVTLPASLDKFVIPNGEAEVGQLINLDNEIISVRLADWTSRWQQEIAT